MRNDYHRQWYIRVLVICKCVLRREKYKHLPNTTCSDSKPVAFLEILHLRFEQNILLERTVGGAERLISKQTYRSGYGC